MLDLSKMMSVGEAARLLGVSPDRVRQLADRGQLRCVWAPHGRLFDRADVEALAEARRRKTAG